MATYTAAVTKGSGELGEELTGTKTFTITNYTSSVGTFPVGYLTLEGNATANQNLSANANMTGSFSNFTNGVEAESLNQTNRRFSISIFGSGGSFQFTPSSTIAANSYYIKGVGPFDLTIT